MMIGKLGWEKIDLIRVLKHLAAMVVNYATLSLLQYGVDTQIY